MVEILRSFWALYGCYGEALCDSGTNFVPFLCLIRWSIERVFTSIQNFGRGEMRLYLCFKWKKCHYLLIYGEKEDSASQIYCFGEAGSK
jgi:hypothetical protein